MNAPLEPNTCESPDRVLAAASEDAQGGPAATKAAVITMIAILFALQAVDGMDQLVLSFTAPFVRMDLDIGLQPLGAALSAGFVGAAFGSVLFGTLADYFSRKLALCVSAMSFSVGCLCTVFVHSGLELIVVRLFTGLALGGLFPVVATLTLEGVPKHLRASATTFVSVGQAVGASLCGPLVAIIEPRLGWRAVFIIGGLVPAALTVLALVFIPNSKQAPGKLARTAHAQNQAVRNPFDSVASLFRQNRWKSTLVIWVAFILSAIPMFFSLSWLPSLAHAAHIAPNAAAIGPSIFSAAGLVIALVVARITDRIGLLPVALTAGLGAPAFIFLGQSFGSDESFLIACGLAGAVSLSAVNLIGVIAGLFYEDALRARGVGWAVAVMRLGAALAPGLGGFFIARAVPVETLFTGIAVAPLLSGLAVAALWRMGRPAQTGSVPGPAALRVQTALMPKEAPVADDLHLSGRRDPL